MSYKITLFLLIKNLFSKNKPVEVTVRDIQKEEKQIKPKIIKSEELIKNLPFKELVAEIKGKIKLLAEEQKENKKFYFRSTFMKFEISAHLNFYNEIRGKEYRHGDENYRSFYYYKKVYDKLKKQYPLPN